jgi:ATP-dependent Zn protease
VNGRLRNLFFPLLVIVALAWLAVETLRDDTSNRAVYSDVIVRAEQDPTSIDLVVFLPQRQKIEVRLTNGQELTTYYPTDDSQLEFQQLLQSKHIRFDSKGAGASPLWTALSTLLPFLLLFGFWIFLMRTTRVKDRDRN